MFRALAYGTNISETVRDIRVTFSLLARCKSHATKRCNPGLCSCYRFWDIAVANIKKFPIFTRANRTSRSERKFANDLIMNIMLLNAWSTKAMIIQDSPIMRQTSLKVSVDSVQLPTGRSCSIFINKILLIKCQVRISDFIQDRPLMLTQSKGNQTMFSNLFVLSTKIIFGQGMAQCPPKYVTGEYYT